MAQVRNKWRALVNTVINLGAVPVGNFFSDRGAISFSKKRTLLYGGSNFINGST
jgi:hypothetical protein